MAYYNPTISSSSACNYNIAIEAIRDFITNREYPCIFARTAFLREAFRIGIYDRIDNPNDIKQLGVDLSRFINEQPSIYKKVGNNFLSTFVGIFVGSEDLPSHHSDLNATQIDSKRTEYERDLWKLLQELHNQDEEKWDSNTSSDPNNSNFSFSFGGKSFFIVGLHPHSPRLSRRFNYSTIVFNAHSQFEELRRQGQDTFQKAQEKIRTRDIALQGTINPNLQNFGDDSEAKQYSGNEVKTKWVCPFKSKGD